MNTYLLYCHFQQKRHVCSTGARHLRCAQMLAGKRVSCTGARTSPRCAVPEVAIATATATVVTVTATVAGLAAAVEPPARSNP